VATRLTLATQNKTLLDSSTIASPSSSFNQLPIPSLNGEHVTYTPPHKRTDDSFATPPRTSNSSFTRSRACLNCGSLEHLMARCPLPRSEVKAGRAKLLTTVAELVIPSITTVFLCHGTPVAELMLARGLGCSDLDYAHDWATFNYQWYTCEKYDVFDLGTFCPLSFPPSRTMYCKPILGGRRVVL
jgi:hypothetical protein